MPPPPAQQPPNSPISPSSLIIPAGPPNPHAKAPDGPAPAKMVDGPVAAANTIGLEKTPNVNVNVNVNTAAFKIGSGSIASVAVHSDFFAWVAKEVTMPKLRVTVYSIQGGLSFSPGDVVIDLDLDWTADQACVAACNAIQRRCQSQIPQCTLRMDQGSCFGFFGRTYASEQVSWMERRGPTRRLVPTPNTGIDGTRTLKSLGMSASRSLYLFSGHTL